MPFPLAQVSRLKGPVSLCGAAGGLGPHPLPPLAKPPSALVSLQPGAGPGHRGPRLCSHTLPFLFLLGSAPRGV